MKKVLHVGCGPKRANGVGSKFAGYEEIRLDIDPNVSPDIVASITSMPMVETGSMDGIFSCHNLEHLAHHEVPLCLSEFYRVLAPGGEAVITVPDLVSAIMAVKDNDFEAPIYTSTLGPISALDCIYGRAIDIAAGNNFMQHKTGFSAQTLGRALDKAGFEKVTIYLGPMELWAMCEK